MRSRFARVVRHYAGLAHVYNGLREVLETYNAKDPKRAAPLIKQVERLLSEPLVGIALRATDDLRGEK